MDTNRMPLDNLRQEVVSGKITYDDIVKRLSVAIEIEYLKESPDVDFINACEDLLWEIGTEGQQEFTSVSERCLETIGSHSQDNPLATGTGKQSFGFAKRFAIVLAAFALLIFTTRGAIHLGWFSQSSSHDEQQYIIQGHSIDATMIAQSIAEHEGFDSLQTNNWDELVDFLCFTPSIIDPDVFATTDMQYIAFVESDLIMLVVRYNASTDTPIILTTSYFLDVQEAYIALEQDVSGTKHTINNTVVYCSTNIENNLFTWVKDNILYSIMGDIDHDRCLNYVQKMIGGSQK